MGNGDVTVQSLVDDIVTIIRNDILQVKKVTIVKSHLRIIVYHRYWSIKRYHHNRPIYLLLRKSAITLLLDIVHQDRNIHIADTIDLSMILLEIGNITHRKRVQEIANINRIQAKGMRRMGILVAEVFVMKMTLKERRVKQNVNAINNDGGNDIQL